MRALNVHHREVHAMTVALLLSSLDGKSRSKGRCCGFRVRMGPEEK
jgi:hypothetical protein